MTDQIAALKRERTNLRRKRVTETRIEPCRRCGGEGGFAHWPGYTCYRCFGRNPRTFEHRQVRVYEDHDLKQRDMELTAEIERLQAREAMAEQREKDHEIALKWEAAREARKERARHAEWVGEVGERLRDLEVEVETVKMVDGYYGPSMLVVFRDESGNALKTFGTGESLWDLERGDTVTLTGTVKDHDEFRELKQTVLTRVKVTR